MMPAPRPTFATGVAQWSENLGKLRDAVRQELIARQVAAHVAPATPGASVLDVGCGQGTQSIRLARLGFHVVGVDVSRELLALAKAAAGREDGRVRQRLRFEHGDLLQLDPALRLFDVVCCHGVLMYLPSLEDAVAAVVGAVRPGGTVSVLTRNRRAIAMRAGMSGDWAGAVAGFDARHYRNRLGIDDVRADEPEEVERALELAGAEMVAWYGVRLFTDHLGDEEVPADFLSLLAAEAEAGRRDPYRSLAALTHTIAVRVH